MKIILRLFFCCLSLLLCHQTYAEQVSLKYVDFYKPLTKAYQHNYQLIELVFSLPKNHCAIHKAQIRTQNSEQELSYTAEQRLFIPFEESLKRQDALMQFDIDGDASRCGIAIQIRSKDTDLKYSRRGLIQLYDEMNKLQAELLGFPLKYFQQDLAGLVFRFDQVTKVEMKTNSSVQSYEIMGNWPITITDINGIDSLLFSTTPAVVSPWIQ